MLHALDQSGTHSLLMGRNAASIHRPQLMLGMVASGVMHGLMGSECKHADRSAPHS